MLANLPNLWRIKMSKTQTIQPAQSKIEKRPTSLHHVFLIDWANDGIFKEIALVKEDANDGTLYGIEVDKLHPIDKSRLKRIVTNQHADKYPLWEIMSQITLKNGYNALDFFHANYVRIKRPRGAAVGGSLADISADLDRNMFDSTQFERDGTQARGSNSNMLDI